MKAEKSGANGAMLNRKQQRRASIQWLAVGLVIALLLFGTFLYLVSQERGDTDFPSGGGHSGHAPTTPVELLG